MIGPASPYVDRIRDVSRRVFYIKCPDYGELIRMKDMMEKYIEINEGFRNVSIQFDFNPMNP